MSTLNIPTVTQDDINTFHNKHFSPQTIDSFFQTFNKNAQQQQQQYHHHHHTDNTTTQDTQEEGEEEDDGLGYYPDGVKRTLTDEQIAIFRHSEEEALRRIERKKLEEAKKRLEESFLAKFDGEGSSSNDGQKTVEGKDNDGDEEEGSVEGGIKEDKVMEEEKKMESIGRVDPASGKTFMWPAISSGN